MKKNLIKKRIQILPAVILLMFCLVVSSWATPKVTVQLPAWFDYGIDKIIGAKGEDSSSFEYRVSFTANVPLQGVWVYFTKNDEITLDDPLEEFKGNMSRGQTVSWLVKGKVEDVIHLDDGTSMFPFLRLEAEYGFPRKEIEKEIHRLYDTPKEEDHFAFGDYLRQLERMLLKEQEKVKFQKIWNP